VIALSPDETWFTGEPEAFMDASNLAILLGVGDVNARIAVTASDTIADSDLPQEDDGEALRQGQLLYCEPSPLGLGPQPPLLEGGDHRLLCAAAEVVEENLAILLGHIEGRSLVGVGRAMSHPALDCPSAANTAQMPTGEGMGDIFGVDDATP
jgi:hypothetical protein